MISVTASSGYDANTGEIEKGEERELPSTVTLLVTIEQCRVLAEMESDGKLHLVLVYRGQPENAAKFIAAQDEVNALLYTVETESEQGDELSGQENNQESVAG